MEGGRRERRPAGNQHSAGPGNLCPLSLPAAVGDLDEAVTTLDLDENSGRGFYRSGGFVVALSVLDRCWRHVIALLLLAICPTVIGWNSLAIFPLHFVPFFLFSCEVSMCIIMYGIFVP